MCMEVPVWDVCHELTVNTIPVHGWWTDRALYEYVASGSDDEQTLWENRQGFKRHLLCPRVGVDVSKVDMR